MKMKTKCDEAFSELKRAITSTPILVPLNWKKSFRGHVDASEITVGGTLTQLDDTGKDRLIAFFSRKLNLAWAKLYSYRSRATWTCVFPSKIKMLPGGIEFQNIDR